MSYTVEWITRVNQGFGLTPPDVRGVSDADFYASLDSRYEALAGAANARRAAGQPPIWCDDTHIILLKDQRSITEHMIAVSDSAGAAPGTLGPIQGIMTLGHDNDRDSSSVLTIHMACAKTPAHLHAMLQTLVGARRLKSYGITQVNATIFPPEIVVYVRNGFRVVPGSGRGTIEVTLDVSKLGGKRRQSRSVRSKRKRSTRKNRLKQ